MLMLCDADETSLVKALLPNTVASLSAKINRGLVLTGLKISPLNADDTALTITEEESASKINLLDEVDSSNMALTL